MSVLADDAEIQIHPAGSMMVTEAIDITAEHPGEASQSVTDSDIEFFSYTKDFADITTPLEAPGDTAAEDSDGPILIDRIEDASKGKDGDAEHKDASEADDNASNAEADPEGASELSDPGESAEASQANNVVAEDVADEAAEEAEEDYADDEDEDKDASGESDTGSEYTPDAAPSKSKTTKARSARSTHTRKQRHVQAHESEEPEPEEPEEHDDSEKPVEEEHNESETKPKRRGGKRGKAVRREPQPEEAEDEAEHADPDEAVDVPEPEKTKRRGGRKRAKPVEQEITPSPSDEEIKPAKRSRKGKVDKKPALEDIKPVVDEDGSIKPGKRPRRAKAEKKPILDHDEEEPAAEQEEDEVKPGKRARKSKKSQPDLDLDPAAEDDVEEDVKPAKRARKAKKPKIEDVKPKLSDLEPDKSGRRVKSEPLPTEPDTKPDTKPAKPSQPRAARGRWSPEDRTLLYHAAVEANCGGKVRGERFAAGVAGRNAKQCLDAWQKTAEPFILKYLSEEPKPVPKDWRAEPTGRKGWDGAALQALFLAAVGEETPRFTEGIGGRSKNTTRDTWK